MSATSAVHGHLSSYDISMILLLNLSMILTVFDLSIRRISPVGTTAMCSLSGVSGRCAYVDVVQKVEMYV